MRSIADERRKFLSERCGEYAIALHEYLGLPIYVLVSERSLSNCSIDYVFVSGDGGKTGLDAQGAVSVDDLVATCALGHASRRVTVSRMSRERLAWELGILEDECLAEARQLVSEEYECPSRCPVEEPEFGSA